MFTLLFLICMLGIFGKLLVFGLRAAWGVSKLLLTVVFFPVILIGMVFAGLIYLAFPILIIVGIVTLYKYITSPKEESIPLETTLEDAAELTTQKMIISDVFRSTKGTIPHCTIDEESIKIKSSDLKIYDTNFAIMSVDKEVVMELVGEAEKKAKKKAESDEYGFLENADENAKKVIKGMFENVADGREVVVEFTK